MPLQELLFKNFWFYSADYLLSEGFVMTISVFYRIVRKYKCHGSSCSSCGSLELETPQFSLPIPPHTCFIIGAKGSYHLWNGEGIVASCKVSMEDLQLIYSGGFLRANEVTGKLRPVVALFHGPYLPHYLKFFWIAQYIWKAFSIGRLGWSLCTFGSTEVDGRFCILFFFGRVLGSVFLVSLI